MSDWKFQLDRKGGAEVLKQIAAAEIAALTERVGEGAGDEAVVHHSVTDRARGSVSVPAAQQAKDGRLTKAAGALGLEVRAKGPRQ